ncbi:MAG: hypothetical protein ABI333_24775 [bacterium]
MRTNNWILLSAVFAGLVLGGCGDDDGGVQNDAATCDPTSCQSQGKNCGSIMDGCGQVLQCGACTAPEVCGGGGVSNVCAEGTCQATTCVAEQAECGQISDGCSDVLECGSCTGEETCGGGGTANVCGSSTAEHLSDDMLMAQGNAPDFSCFDAADPALSFAVDTEISGIVEDFEEEWAVEGVLVAIYASLQDLLDDNPFDTSTETPPTGAYTVLAPAGVPRLFFKMWDPLGEDYFVTMELNEPVAGMPPGPPQATGKDRIIVSAVTMETVPAILGINRIDGRGIVAGRVYDCNAAEVQNAAMRAYDAPASDPNRVLLSIYEGGERNSFYFANGMPVRGQIFTDVEGQFITANLIATPGAAITMEFWGRWSNCPGGCLISSQEIPVLPDSIVVTDMLPLYSN